MTGGEHSERGLGEVTGNRNVDWERGLGEGRRDQRTLESLLQVNRKLFSQVCLMDHLAVNETRTHFLIEFSCALCRILR